ncbi:hypothetical protein DUA64_05795 [Salmonella enterica subsp. enterica serovar Abony]|nr:hypothetical protein [Salmonella enterica subsp. enterica serovar Abony]EBY6397688.1 hypothetical protein [Salmonella enterica subsp. enterica serovar Abony]
MVGSHTDGTPEPDFQKHTDPEQQLNDVMAVKQEIFALPPYPNWTAVGVTWLAGFDFEIKVIARIP